MRPRAAFLSFAGAVLIATAATSSALASSPVPRGQLTQHEFTLISAAQMGLGVAFSQGNTKRAFAQAQDECKGVTFGISTPLLVSERASCLRQVSLTITITSFQQADTKCAAASSAQARFRCDEPLLKKLASDAGAAYAVDAKVERVSQQRGFTGTCLAALAFTQQQLEVQRRLASVSRRLSVSFFSMPGTVHGSRTAVSLTLSQAQRNITALEALMNKVLGAHSPAVSTCRQQTA